MDRLCGALSLGQNSSSSSNKDSKKNKEIMIPEKIENSLQDWKLPPSSASDVFKRSSRSSYSADSRIKTVEKEIPISEDYSTFPLFTDNLQRVHLKDDSDLDLHVGMIRVALKTTKLASDTSAIICLRDKRLVKFHESILGMVEASLGDGPIYFSYFPTHSVSLSDPHLSSAFTIDIKTQGSSDENVILMYRFHYKVLSVFDSDPRKLRSSLVVDGIGETTLFITNLARSNRVVSKKFHWDQIDVPERWMVTSNKPSSEGAAANARVDWKETAEAHVLKVDVPGFKKEDVKIEVEDGKIVQISGERIKEEEEEGEKDKWYCMERGGGKFLRRFSLPENARLDRMKAAMENGVLTVTVPTKGVNEKPEVKVIDVSG